MPRNNPMYTELAESNTPRVTIVCHKVNDNHAYNVSISGEHQIFRLIGGICRAQQELVTYQSGAPGIGDSDPTFRHCEDPLLVVFFLKDSICWFVNPEIPIDDLLGTLETVKLQVIQQQQQQAARMQAMQTPLVLGPNGQPFRGNY